MRERRRQQGSRKRIEEEPDNHDRWLVSYADFMTLLFAFFVVMYAISSVNQGKYRVLSEALGTAFGRTGGLIGPIDPQLLHRPQIQLPRPRPNDALLRRERDKMTNVARDLLKVLAPLVSQGKVRVTETARGISIEINDSILFAQGEARLSAESSEVLKAIAQILKLAGCEYALYDMEHAGFSILQLKEQCSYCRGEGVFKGMRQGFEAEWKCGRCHGVKDDDVIVYS